MMSIPPSISKPLVAGGLAYAADQYLNNSVSKYSLYFGVSVAAGLVISDLIIQNTSLFEKTALGGIEARMLQVGLSTGGAVGIDKLVFKDSLSGSANITQKVGIIVGSEIASDYLVNTLMGNQLV